ncbi:tRNA (adenosine(37)-N6)-dimethylallyltransferase MiaA [Anaerobranca gottschalkii]|uniref:tRNA dimethylallyltransferase n=1 Tax=Anaerobranca gottschalkii DSM 13577 TaxID=1120990 RepID=A0A1H9Z6V0_9FIRM|nr:tRNA (adenosine(37)-N6)-dimethylallyltransferase MiaA [Anaerobranca gottschalkii]SES77207.1 tRNA dimethylallyltransferase [Anaerobranca gottschalkii DSM 13577]
MEDNYVVILGPTASGKTALSIQLAKQTNDEIISADSMLIYKGMDIGTAKPTKEEMEGIPHHLIDIIEPDEEFSVYDYQILSQKTIREIKERGKLPIVVGGTGLYIRALTEDFTLNQIPQDEAVRKKYYEIMINKGKEYLHSLLKDKDPIAYEKLHPNDYKRVIRALEVYELSGNSIYNLQEKKHTNNNILYIGLTMDREILYKRVNDRVDIMLKQGLVDEVRALLAKGISKEANSMKGIGYKQVIEYLEGRLDYDKMVEILKRDTRRYAKRQLTWFRGMEGIYWLDITKMKKEDIITKILEKMKEKQIL